MVGAPAGGSPRVVLLGGGTGGAALAGPLASRLGAGYLTVVANVGDDLSWHGLRVCPDIDTILYALAGRLDARRGFGVSDDTFAVRDQLARLGEHPWFAVGDRDLATHVLRSELLGAGGSLTTATGDIARRMGISDPAVLPASDSPCPTYFELVDGELQNFQQWYVEHDAAPPLRACLLSSGPAAPSALRALVHADAVIIAPSSPITSVATILQLRGMLDAVASVPIRIAVSPVLANAASPDANIAQHTRARMHALATKGSNDSPAGIAQFYAHEYPGLLQCFVIDRRDILEAPAVAHHGIWPIPADLLHVHRLASTLVELIESSRGSWGARSERQFRRSA